MNKPMKATRSPHIDLDDRGIPWIDDTNVKVVEVVLDQMAYGWSPEEIHLQQPHLSLAQIYAALAYYHDHRKDIDDDIARRDKLVKESQAQAGEPVHRNRHAHQLTASIGQCISSLEEIAKMAEPSDLTDRVVYLPL